ncbi:glycosyltransferase family 4 protein [Trichothermofontia sp.]
MKITIVTGPWFPVPAIQGGAVERRWQGVAEALVMKGHQVVIVCRSFPGQPAREVYQGVQYIRKSGFSQGNNIVFDLLKDLLYAVNILFVLPEADILVINDFWLPVLVIFRSRVDRILIAVARYPKYQHVLYFKASRFIATSNAIRATLIQQYPQLTSIVKVIPNPINTRIFSPSKQATIIKNKKQVLYVGRIHKEKGIHLLLEAFSFIDLSDIDCQLRIIGPHRLSQGGSGEAYYRDLQQQADGLPVEFSSPIFDVDKLAAAYRQANIFCYPSLAEQGESFGVAPLEAMACGLVPIVSSLDCFRDFIEDEITGYYFDHRTTNAAENLANTLVKALTNWDKILKMREKAIQKAQEFSYERIADLYLQEFQTLVNQ